MTVCVRRHKGRGERECVCVCVCVCVRGGIMILQLADDGQHCLAPSINKVMIKVGQERPQLGALGVWGGGQSRDTAKKPLPGFQPG